MRVVIVTVLMIGVAWGCTSSSENLSDVNPTVTPQELPPSARPCLVDDPSCPTPNENPEQGDLTTEQMMEAERIAEEDPTLSDLLRDANYTMNVGPYQAQLGVPGIFVSMEYALEEALAVDHDLPHIDTGHRGGEADPTQIVLPSPGYEINVSHHDIEAWSLMVIVLLEEERVVEILPLPFGPAVNPPTENP